MPRLPFARHPPASKLRHKYRSCRHPVERPRSHALWLPARTDPPRTRAEVADLVGLSAATVRSVLHRWNERGPAARRAVEVWAEDEARLRLKPVTRRVWWPRASAPSRAGGPGTSGCPCTGSPGPPPGRRSPPSCLG
jgi:hypothetical protein